MSDSLYDGVKKIAVDSQVDEVQYGYVTSVTSTTVSVAVKSSKSSITVDRPAGFLGGRGDECTLARNKRTGLWEIVSVKNNSSAIITTSATPSEVLLDSGVAEVSSTSFTIAVPAGYSDIRLRMNVRIALASATFDTLKITANNDATAIYDSVTQYMTGAGVAYRNTFSGASWVFGAFISTYDSTGEWHTDYQSPLDLTIYNYASTEYHRTVLGRSQWAIGAGTGSWQHNIHSGIWRNEVDAIYSLVIAPSNASSTFAAGCDWRLYGIL